MSWFFFLYVQVTCMATQQYPLSLAILFTEHWLTHWPLHPLCQVKVYDWSHNKQPQTDSCFVSLHVKGLLPWGGPTRSIHDFVWDISLASLFVMVWRLRTWDPDSSLQQSDSHFRSLD